MGQAAFYKNNGFVIIVKNVITGKIDLGLATKTVGPALLILKNSYKGMTAKNRKYFQN